MAVASATMATPTTAAPAPATTRDPEADSGIEGGALVDMADRVDEDTPTPAPDAVPAIPVSGSSARPKSPIVHGSYEKADSDEEEVMVKTEFVWADGAEMDVKLSGAWNGWMPVQMYHEGGMYQLFSLSLSLCFPLGFLDQRNLCTLSFIYKFLIEFPFCFIFGEFDVCQVVCGL